MDQVLIKWYSSFLKTSISHVLLSNLKQTDVCVIGCSSCGCCMFSVCWWCWCVWFDLPQMFWLCFCITISLSLTLSHSLTSLCCVDENSSFHSSKGFIWKSSSQHPFSTFQCYTHTLLLLNNLLNWISCKHSQTVCWNFCWNTFSVEVSIHSVHLYNPLTWLVQLKSHRLTSHVSHWWCIGFM